MWGNKACDTTCYLKGFKLIVETARDTSQDYGLVSHVIDLWRTAVLVFGCSFS